MKLGYLLRGLPGHPLHPPLTDATIGAYTASTIMALASVVGIAHIGAAHGWWLALVVGLIVTELLLKEIPPATLKRFIRVHETPRLVVR